MGPRPAAACAALWLAAAGIGAGEGPSWRVWANPIDDAQIGLYEALAADATHPLSVIAVTGLREGQALAPIAGGLLGVASEPERSAFAQLTRDSARKRTHVMVFLDALHWELSTSDQLDVLNQRPDLLEVNYGSTCGSAVGAGRYVSPCHPAVKAALTELAGRIPEIAPAPPGLIVRCRLSPTEILGYSEAQRLAYVRAAAIDPIDLLPVTGDAVDKTCLEAWSRWRLGALTELLTLVAAAFRGEAPSGTVTAAVLAGAYREPVAKRTCAAEDWLTWILDDIIDGVLLEGAWEEGSEDRDYASALGIIAKTGKEIEIGVMLR
ncbi:MAG: hypothetical protein FJX74_15590, partial [Armatimonadetes bacterium]|nr:hypothetical protein [Armatimonadota bacterium]